MSTPISAAAAGAREQARQDNGQFGTQPLAEGGDLDLLDAAGMAEAPEQAPLGEQLEPITLAEARRMMPVGTTVQTFFPGRLDGELRVREVTKMSDHQAKFRMEDGRESLLDWKSGTKAFVDSSGAIVLKDPDGTPFVVYIPLDSADDALDPGTAVHPDLITRHREAKTTTDPGVLDSIARSPIPLNRAYAAENPHADVHTLARLANDDSAMVRRKVAANPSTSPGVLDTLADDPDTGAGPNEAKVAYWVSVNPSASAHAMAKLARLDDEAIRCSVARHRATSPQTLRELATTPRPGREFVDGNVRSAVASNPMTPSDILAKWEKSDGWTMPQVAKNPSTPADVLERMATDTSTGNQTRAMVASNPSAPAHVVDRLVAEGDSWIREHAATNPALSSESANRLFQSPEEKVRRALAANPGADKYVLGRLQADPSPFVRRALAKNPSLHFDTLGALMRDDNPSVRQALADNPATPPSVREQLLATT